MNEGPFTLIRVESEANRALPCREGLWRLSWKDGQMIFSGWSRAMDWLDDLIAKKQIDSNSVLLAGPYAVPWVLEWYLIAANEAERDNREGVFDAYSKSAMELLTQDKDHHDQLMKPWATHATD